MKYSLWDNVKEVANENIGKEFSRKELIEKIGENFYTYFIDLLETGFVERVSRGRYKFIKKIPDVPLINLYAYKRSKISLQRLSTVKYLRRKPGSLWLSLINFINSNIEKEFRAKELVKEFGSSGFYHYLYYFCRSGFLVRMRNQNSVTYKVLRKIPVTKISTFLEFYHGRMNWLMYFSLGEENEKIEHLE